MRLEAQLLSKVFDPLGNAADPSPTILQEAFLKTSLSLVMEVGEADGLASHARALGFEVQVLRPEDWVKSPVDASNSEAPTEP